MSEASTIVIVGLGYVGLPLAVALAEHGRVTGFDLDPQRIAELRAGHDRTREVPSERLEASSVALTADAADCAGADVYIVTVPTPIDTDNEPDLGPLIAASRAIAVALDSGSSPLFAFRPRSRWQSATNLRSLAGHC